MLAEHANVPLLQVIVTVGVAIASYGELRLVLLGVILQLAAVVTESTRLILVQILLQVCSSVVLWHGIALSIGCAGDLGSICAWRSSQQVVWMEDVQLRQSLSSAISTSWGQLSNALRGQLVRDPRECTHAAKRLETQPLLDNVLHRPGVLWRPVRPVDLCGERGRPGAPLCEHSRDSTL